MLLTNGSVNHCSVIHLHLFFISAKISFLHSTDFYSAPTMCKQVLEIEWRQQCLFCGANNIEIAVNILLNVLKKLGYTILCVILLNWYHIRKGNNEALLFADFILAANELASENGIHYLSLFSFHDFTVILSFGSFWSSLMYFLLAVSFTTLSSLESSLFSHIFGGGGINTTLTYRHTLSGSFFIF